MYTQFFKIAQLGCHGNHAISHNQNIFIFEFDFFLSRMVSLNKLACIKIVLGVQSYLITPGLGTSLPMVFCLIL